MLRTLTGSGPREEEEKEERNLLRCLSFYGHHCVVCLRTQSPTEIILGKAGRGGRGGKRPQTSGTRRAKTYIHIRRTFQGRRRRRRTAISEDEPLPILGAPYGRFFLCAPVNYAPGSCLLVRNLLVASLVASTAAAAHFSSLSCDLWRKHLFLGAIT